MDSTLRLDLAPSPSSLDPAFDALTGFCREHAVSDAMKDLLLVALEEVLYNVINHGNAASISFSARLENGKIEMVVADDGPEFNPLELPPPDLTSPIEERSVGGLGVFLVLKLMTSVTYERRNGTNCFTMLRDLDAPAGWES